MIIKELKKVIESFPDEARIILSTNKETDLARVRQINKIYPKKETVVYFDAYLSKETP